MFARYSIMPHMSDSFHPLSNGDREINLHLTEEGNLDGGKISSRSTQVEIIGVFGKLQMG